MKGKYNGRKIVGFRLTIRFRYDGVRIKPRLKWNYGEPYFFWLGFYINYSSEYGRHMGDE